MVRPLTGSPTKIDESLKFRRNRVHLAVRPDGRRIAHTDLPPYSVFECRTVTTRPELNVKRKVRTLERRKFLIDALITFLQSHRSVADVMVLRDLRNQKGLYTCLILRRSARCGLEIEWR